MRSALLRLIGFASIAVAVLLEVSCNASTSDNSDTTTASASGIWSATDMVSGLGVTALINAAGQATFIRSDGIQFVGSLQLSGSNLAMTVDGYPDFSTLFADGSDFGIGTMNGTVSTGNNLTATLTFNTDGSTAINGNFSLTYETLSDTASSPSAISGDYTDTVTGATLSIASTGVLSGQTPSNGCALNGTVSTNDATHNVYEVAYTYSSCTGSYQVLNGVQLSGLATVNVGLSPRQAVMAVTGASGANHYGIVSNLTGT